MANDIQRNLTQQNLVLRVIVDMSSGSYAVVLNVILPNVAPINVVLLNVLALHLKNLNKYLCVWVPFAGLEPILCNIKNNIFEFKQVQINAM